MSDLISREYMKSLGATCIASRSKDGTLFPIVSIDELQPADPTHPTPSNTLGALDISGLDEEIRCTMCKNPMRTDRGCDGGCKYDEKLYADIMKVLHGRIKELPSVQPEIIRCKDCRYSIDEYGDGECYCKRPSRELVWIGKRWDFFCAAARLKMEVEHE